ncbi:VOC family protein [Novosphingobium aquimarinum]|uniref:VOC family protein n=1 Tax=Novosphingobium aquimarinum TaxID=2682494 RepID=UPI0012EB5D0C|nr:VOC family protein [Novosphingobium aquimarinum]
MFSHVMLGANDIAASKAFYDAALGALGVPEGAIDEIGRIVYAHAGSRFVVRTPLNGEPATGANGGTLGFLAGSPAEVDAWHAAGLSAGGTAIEDPPGIRDVTEGRQVYLAYLRDPAGNKLCAFYRVK